MPRDTCGGRVGLRLRRLESDAAPGIGLDHFQSAVEPGEQSLGTHPRAPFLDGA